VTRVDDDPLSLDELVAAFEAELIPPADFTHARHVRVAWGLLRRHPPDEAYARLVAGLRSFATRAGRPDAFHETITRAWFELIGQSADLADDPELQDRGLLARYYSRAALAAGRREWVEPDLHPLVLPPPAPARPADG
jgi:hypothetical protein